MSSNRFSSCNGPSIDVVLKCTSEGISQILLPASHLDVEARNFRVSWHPSTLALAFLKTHLLHALRDLLRLFILGGIVVFAHFLISFSLSLTSLS